MNWGVIYWIVNFKRFRLKSFLEFLIMTHQKEAENDKMRKNYAFAKA